MEVTVGDSWTDAGATAEDDVDGDITDAIQVTGTVDTTTPGLYTVTYSATDTAGNTGEASRVVTVKAATSSTDTATTTTSSSTDTATTASSTPATGSTDTGTSTPAS